MNRVFLSFILLSPSLVHAHTVAANHVPIEVTPNVIDTTHIKIGKKLHGVTVYANRKKFLQMQSSVNRIVVDRNYLKTNFAGSLMQTLSGIPGVKAMSIGSGESKPTIRGLGFNRMVVTEDGIKHEGQQWGDDHGLEVDQFSIDRAEVIKGPAALLYGSDAIGGVISLYSNYVPTSPFEGSVSLFTRTNNSSLGIATQLGGRKNKLYWRANVTTIDYGDYKVPTDSIEYYSYRIPLYHHDLRNTAGRELDASAMFGYIGYRFKNDVKISNTYTKAGFFANAHGLEVRLSSIDYDRSARDIDLPWHSVNHFKIMDHAVYEGNNYTLQGSLAYQNNLRQERSEPVSHGYMPIPPNTLEREFNKHTFTGQLQFSKPFANKHRFQAGINGEYQFNRRKGWGFIIPDFETLSMGIFAMDKYTVTPDLILNAGVRYDFSRIRIHSYNDWYKTPVGNHSVYKERSVNIRRFFNSITWSAGVNYAIGQWLLKANIGKSFRMPIPKELGTDGVNYHIFRYEKGTPDLKPEESYQIDAGLNWSNGIVDVQVDPYINYFPNYIYLNPTSMYYEGLQKYYYTQSRVLRYGFEAVVNWKITHYLEADAKGAYLYAEQLSGQKKGYTLPFTTPWTMDADLKYTFEQKPNREGFVSLNCHVIGTQNNIVPPEKKTPGAFTINMTAGKSFHIKHCECRISLNGENLLNRKYYDHTSYYRLMNIPEPGRNFALMLDLHF